MTISLERHGDAASVMIEGNIDTAGGKDLSARLMEIMGWDDVRDVRFDMRTVQTITSSAIGKLINFFKYMEEKEGSMRIVALSDSLREQFREIHLDHVIPILKKEE